MEHQSEKPAFYYRVMKNPNENHDFTARKQCNRGVHHDLQHEQTR